MAKAKQPGPTGAEPGAQDEQNSPAPGAEPTTEPAAEAVPQAPEAEVAPAEPVVEPPTGEILLLVKARVLVSGVYGQCNDVVEIDADIAKALPDVLDATPEAVAYAESLAD